MLRHKRLLLIAGAIALLVAAVHPSRPHADLTILAHRAGDTAPQQMHAAIDMGIFAVSVFVTWSRQIAR